MPWTKSNYPVSLKNLPAAVRNKAIEIANALLDEGKMEEGIAIATATSRAKDWAANRGMKSEAPAGTSKTTDVKKHGEDRHVIPRADGWMVKKESASKGKIYDTKKEALSVAGKAAKSSNSSVTVKSRDGKIESRKSYNPNLKKKQQS